ncbi:MAG TPA: universal stress protein [Mycobacteriales bacterium]
MYDNVVIGVDGHQGGQDAASLARFLASDAAHFTLAYVGMITPVAHATNLEFELADHDDLPRMLAAEMQICGENTAITRIYAGSVGAGLEDVAEETHADLIVVGVSQRHGIARLLSGDDVKSVLHQTQRAVAIAPIGHESDSRAITRIGVAVDDASATEVAVAHAGLLAEHLDARLIPFGVVEPHPYAVGWGTVAVPIEDPARAMQTARERLGEVDGQPVEVVYGTVGEELDKFSDHVDLLVCGSRRPGAALRLLLGSTSDHLARHTRTPLLIAPPRDDAAVARWRERRRAGNA